MGVLDYTHSGPHTQRVYSTTHTMGVLDYTHVVTAMMPRDLFYVSISINKGRRGGGQEGINDVH